MKIREKFKNIKSSRPSLFIVTILVFLTAGLFLNYLSEIITKRNSVEIAAPAITNSQAPETKLKDIKINTDLPEVADQMDVFSSGSNKTAQEMAKGIAQIFRLESHPELENIWIDQNNQYFLSYSPISDQITLSDLKTTPNNQTLNKNEAINSAKKFVDLLKLNFQVEVNQDQTNSESYEVHQGDETEVVSFNQKLNGLNLFHSSNPTNTIYVFVSQDYKVSKIIINNPSLVANYSGKAKTLSSSKVLSEVKKGEGTVLSVFDSTGNIDASSEPSNVNLNSVRLEYRDDVENGNIIPFYRFSGSAKSENDEPLKIEIIYPAIETS